LTEEHAFNQRETTNCDSADVVRTVYSNVASTSARIDGRRSATRKGLQAPDIEVD